MDGMEDRTPVSDEAAAVQNDGEANDAKAKPSMLLRCAWGFAGVFVPLVCFAIGFPDRPRWQSGNPRDFAALMLSHWPSLPMYPLLLFSMVCLWLLAGWPAHFAKSKWIWLGIFSGAVLAFEYWIVFVLAVSDTAALDIVRDYIVALVLSGVAVGLPWVGCLLVVLAIRWLARPSKKALSILTTILVLALGAAFIVFIICLPWLAMLSLVCSTPWAVAAYGSAAIWLVRQRGAPYFRYTLAQLLTAVTALAANFAAWRTAYEIMLIKYAELPTQPPPDCFVCSAAARGHSSVVRSTSFRRDGEEMIAVNDQLRVLKALELLILALSPAAHRGLRRVYNRIGPRLAAALVYPPAADAAYFVLKPIEWFARFALRLVLGKRTALIRRLYRV
jgi:hypothetical protein